MDSVHWFLAPVTALAPLLAAAAIAVADAFRLADAARRFASLGAAVSFCAAAAGFVQGLGPFAAGDSLVSLGVWLAPGLHHGLAIPLDFKFDAASSAIAAVIALSACCLFSLDKPRESTANSDGMYYAAASILVTAAIAGALSAHLAELAMFWQLASAAAYLLLLARSDAAPRSAYATKLVVILRISDACLLCALLGLASAFPALDFRNLFNSSGGWAGATVRHPALADFLALFLLGACIGRCALIPVLSWSGTLAEGGATSCALIEGIALMPAGALLVFRCAPVFDAASSSAALAAFVGAASAFASAVCALGAVDPRRSAVYACGSLYGLIVFGASVGGREGATWGLVLAAALAPASVVILGSAGNSGRSGAGTTNVPLVVSILVLFSGICGQGGILAAGAQQTFQRRPAFGGVLPPAIMLLAGCAQAIAAFAAWRTAWRLRMPSVENVPGRPTIIDVTPADSTVVPQRWPTVVASSCLLVIGIAAVLALLVKRPEGLGLGSAVRVLAGCFPAIAGLFFAGLVSRSGVSRDPSADGLLVRLGRHGFYFDGLLFLFVGLPLRGIAQLARLMDGFVIDGLIAGGPASSAVSAALILEPVERRSARFYILCAVMGTALLAVLIVWLRD